MDSLHKTRSSARYSDSCDLLEPLPAFATHQADAMRLYEGSSRLANSFGRLSLENAETSYVESAHWSAILDEVCSSRRLFAEPELKDHFDNENDSIEQRPPAAETLDASGPELVFGHHKCVTKQEILAAMPARPVADRLVATYFASMDLASCMVTQPPAILPIMLTSIVIIHSPTFLKEVSFCGTIVWTSPVGRQMLSMSSMSDSGRIQCGRLSCGLACCSQSCARQQYFKSSPRTEQVKASTHDCQPPSLQLRCIVRR
jgi:hypothetical protein